MRMVKKIGLMTLCAVFSFWVGALALCEYDTYCYSDQFRETIVHDIQGERTLGDETLKVLHYSETEAEIYAVDAYSGRLYWFERDSGKEWCYTDWDVVWSESGTADAYVFPYIRLEGLLGGNYKR